MTATKKDTLSLTYFDIRDIDLTAAHADTLYTLPGVFDTLIVESLTGALSIKLNNVNNGAIDLSRIPVINTAFDRFYYTNAATPGAAVILHVGTEASFGVGGIGVRPATFPPGPLAIGHVASQATTNAYANLGTVNYLQTVVKSTWVLRETGAVNAAKYAMLGSMDNTNWVTLLLDKPLPAGGIAYETLTDLWPYIMFQIIDAVAPNHATVAGLWYYESLL